MAILGDRLKYQRTSKNITQRQMAQLLGIATNAYQNYEYGKREPNNDTLVKLADFFGVSTDYLLGRSDDPTRH